MHPAPDHPRTDALTNWLNNELGLAVSTLEYASDDASFRRYYRITHSGGTHIVMDAPPDKENTEPFIRICALLKQAGIHVPTIYHQNTRNGFLVLEDLGCDSFQDKLNPASVNQLYQSALDCLFRLQNALPASSLDLPVYDKALLERELNIFYQWFLSAWLDREIPKSIHTQLNDLLIESTLDQPRVCVHRDYHCRNLMVLNKNSPGVIDFQDAVIGPVTYDLVSLLRDCYIDWPEQQVENWMQSYFLRLLEARIIDTDLDTFRRWFDLMGLQRHLKAIGIFTRLHLRDQKSGFIKEIPRTLNYVDHVAGKYPDLQFFHAYLHKTIIPVFRAQS